MKPPATAHLRGNHANSIQVIAPHANAALSQTPTIASPASTIPTASAIPCAGGYFD